MAWPYRYCERVIKSGGFDIDRSRIDSFVSDGGLGQPFDEVAADLDVVVLVVLNAQQIESVLFGKDGIAKKMQSASTVIACATVAPDFAIDMENRCKQLGLCYLDAPISGGAAKATSGQLSIMASGKPEAFAGAQQALDAMAETVFELGDKAGKGSAMKAVNQLLAGVHIATMAEAMTFGISQGIEPAEILDVIPKCAGTSWMFENRAPHIVDNDYTPRSGINIWPKDLGIILDIAQKSRFSAPLTAAAMQQFVAAMGSGLADEDDAAVAKIYARNANLSLPGDT